MNTQKIPNVSQQTTSRLSIAVWDWPIRLTHWGLVITMALSWWSAENGEMAVHSYSGFTLLGLLIFRVYWGFHGGSTALFRQFLHGPQSVLSYLRGSQPDAPSLYQPGHTPLGGWSVMLLLLLLCSQVSTGLFAVDVDGLESGPLSRYISFDAARIAAQSHEILFNLLLAMVVIHIGAIVFYLLIRKTNLILPMLNGRKQIAASTAATVKPLQKAKPVTLLSGIVLAVVLAVLITQSARWFY